MFFIKLLDSGLSNQEDFEEFADCYFREKDELLFQVGVGADWEGFGLEVEVGWTGAKEKFDLFWGVCWFGGFDLAWVEDGHGD